MDTEILLYRIVALAFVICLPVALIFAILPTRTLLRKRLLWGAVAFIGLGTLFVGWAASWPGPNTITLVMMFGGFIAFAAGVILISRSFYPSRR